MQQPLTEYLSYWWKRVDIMKFFTVWVIILVVLHRFTSSRINLVFLTLTVFVIGSYFSFVYPRLYKLHIGDSTYIYSSIQRFIIVDCLAHFCTFAFVALLYADTYQLMSSQTLVAFALVMVYLYLFKTTSVYGVTLRELSVPILMSVLMYVVIF